VKTVEPPRLDQRTDSGHLISTEDSVLRIFVAYSHLPPHQFAHILSAVEGVFNAVMMTARDPMTTAMQLCVLDVHTGESIDFKFGGRIPRAKFKKNGDVEFWFPKWTAAIALASTLIGGGVGLLKEGRELIGEFAPKQEQSAPAQHFDHYRLQDPNDVAGRSARYHLLMLHREFDAPNIHRVDVNGVTIRPRPGGEKLFDYPLPPGDFQL
jgi:hypothetical protein